MLGSSELAAFVATTDLGRARAFYGGGGGVRFERFAGMEQDELGVWAAPGGARWRGFPTPTATCCRSPRAPSPRTRR